jgi:hypothetical protein
MPGLWKCNLRVDAEWTACIKTTWMMVDNGSQSIFCDEFGNTGPRLLNTDQPMFLYAFVLVDAANLRRFEDDVRQLYDQEKLSLPELKSSTLYRSHRGQARYAKIGRIASECGARVVMSIVEKRYQVCAMIVETYLDPELNTRAPRELSQPPFRQKIADACYECFDDTRINEFLMADRADDRMQISRVGESFSATLRFHVDDFVSEFAFRMETRPDYVFRYSEKMDKLPRHSDMPASQFAAFYPALELVDAHLGRTRTHGTLVRDVDSQFGQLLDLAFSCGRRLEGLAYRRRFLLTHIDVCRSGSSANEIGIQLADLIVGIFGRVALQALHGRVVPGSLAAVAKSWRATLMPPSEHYLMIADSVLPRTVSAVFESESI